MDLMQQHEAARADLLARIKATLAADDRFMAGWLAGSSGRGEADAISDLDLVIVATDSAAEILCARPWMAAGKTIQARLKLFSRFGEIAAVHENHHNAPPGGTFTFTMYRGSGLIVDWTLIPAAGATRPASTALLFDRLGVPAQIPSPNLTEEQQADALRERLAFFSIMTAVTAKYIARGDQVGALKLLDDLYRMVIEIEALESGAGAVYRRGSAAPLILEPAEQAAAIRNLLRRVQRTASDLASGQEETPLPPFAELDAWLRMAESIDGPPSIG